MPYGYWEELVGGEDSEDEMPQQHNGPSAVPDTEDQDLPDFNPDTGFTSTGLSDDDEENEPTIINEEKQIFQDTEFAILALGEDPEHKEIESTREAADDEYESDENENGIVVTKKRSKLKTDTDVEEKLLVLDYMVANYYTHTSRDKDIPKHEIVDCTTYKDIDTSASYAFVLGEQTDSLEKVAARLDQEKTITDGRENWIPFGDVYRHPRTYDVEVRAMSEDKLGQLAKAMDISIDEVLEKLADQVGKYKR
ncbi:hypothetical protein KCU64_g14431, partial [Aureobasidium melanogenum]